MTENELLYEDENVTLRRYQTGWYGLTYYGLRVIFRYEDTATGTNHHTLFGADQSTVVATLRRSVVPYEVSGELDEIESPPEADG